MTKCDEAMATLNALEAAVINVESAVNILGELGDDLSDEASYLIDRLKEHAKQLRDAYSTTHNSMVARERETAAKRAA